MTATWFWTALGAVPCIAQDAGAPNPPIWTVPEVGALPDDKNGRLVRRGRDLITATYANIGPEVANPTKRYAGNNLACSNCHLEAGTKKFALPIFGLFGEFPQYSPRLRAEITIEDRVNACMTRSMNGRAMPLDAPEMQAIVAYIKFLSTGVPAGQKVPGLGAGKMPELDRAADPARGRLIYVRACVACHNTDGSGVRRSLPTVDLGYMTPPLWGSDSFNDGAGMARLIRLDRDYPDLLQKPVDSPYGPYADGFTQQQHKYGPFAPIRETVARLKAEAGGQKPDSQQ